MRVKILANRFQQLGTLGAGLDVLDAKEIRLLARNDRNHDDRPPAANAFLRGRAGLLLGLLVAARVSPDLDPERGPVEVFQELLFHFDARVPRPVDGISEPHAVDPATGPRVEKRPVLDLVLVDNADAALEVA